ncbi:peroxisomal leader peptide-processing protease isoform X2 [Aplysia californica]|uniref:Peroxisomal leader peptide-processing protease n=1 Tax=Aplysia californica TaxID=6500 RepID=A0ABM0JQZ5_APLCA|nr:peroxisomal leader peptide-processing protease isoform X2 [Aplysia californica]
MLQQGESLSLLACVVKCRLGEVKDECSACGIVLRPDQGIVLTHGSVLADLILQDDALKDMVKSGQFIDGICLKDCEFDVLLDRRWCETSKGQVVWPVAASDASYMKSLRNGSVTSYTKVHSKFLGAFRNDHFHQTVSSLMPKSNWKFANDVSDESLSMEESEKETSTSKSALDESEIAFQLLSYFLVLRIAPITLHQNDGVKNGLETFVSERSVCSAGDVAELIATPFGGLSPGVFFNSFSRGVVSNVSGPRNCWILTDARCIPGSEGAPLFTSGKGESGRHLTGIVAASLCWKNNEWVGFSVACSLDSIMHSLTQQVQRLHPGRSMAALGWTDSLSSVAAWRRLSVPHAASKDWLLATTVLVQVGSTWGSGVIVHQGEGLILTCSHVVKDADSHSVLVRACGGSEHYKAEVLYRQNPVDGPFDVAVLRCRKATAQSSASSALSIVKPVVGQRVYAVGHAVFSADSDLPPSVSAGVVSKIVCSGGQPVMVQSTCAVHPGASGGPLLSASGQLVGILVCNTRDQSNSSCFPHVNMSVPAVAAWTAVQKYRRTGDKQHLHSLQLQNSYVKKLWALGSVTQGNTTTCQSRL